MPLAFESESHGTVAFGFFNIQSDMLLLDRYFLFATEFCKYISVLAACGEQDPCASTWEVFHIADPEDIGDLMGAIHGIRHTGFIGETYRRFPFPADPEDFRQQPDGYENRDVFVAMIGKYGVAREIRVQADPDGGAVNIGEYRFTRPWFHRLLNYVWRGGYPRWKDDVRPDYVTAMKQAVEKSLHPLFKGAAFEP